MNGRRSAAVVVGLALLASACSESRPELGIRAVDEQEIAAELLESAVVFVRRDIEEIDCPSSIARDHLACAVADVAVDHESAAGGAETSVSFAVLEGTASDMPVVAIAQGGPGGASTDLAAWLPRQAFTQVFIDQRGTGFAATDFDCPEYDAALPFLLEAPADALLDIEDDALARCAARIAGARPFSETDTESHAEDVQSIMLNLGHFDGWYFYGVSYGSTIGIELLSENRIGLSGVILDGVYPRSLDLDTDVAISAQAAVDAVTSACQANPACSQVTAEFGADLDAAVLALDESPMLVPISADRSGFGRDVDVRLDGERLADLTFVLMYNESNVAGLPAAIAGIREGDLAAAEWLVGAGTRALASAYSANDEGTYFAVQCHDRAPIADGLEPTGRPFADAIVTQPLSKACELWSRDPGDPEDLVDELRSAFLPTLLLSGQLDPITPPAYAEALARELERATVVTQAGRSHGIWIGNGCIQGIVADFVAAPLGELDTSCADEPVTVDWFTPG